MPDIKEWIKKQLKAGVPPEKIKQGLIEGGYNPNLINEVLTENTKGQNINLATTLMPKPSNIKFILLIMLLAGTSFVLGGIFTLSILQTEPEGVDQSSAPKTIAYEELVEQNPQIAFYTGDTKCRGGLGNILAFTEVAANGQRKLAILTFNDEVIGMLFIWPASEGWAFYATQPEGKPLNVDGVDSYTQTIFLKTPPTTEDCSAQS